MGNPQAIGITSRLGGEGGGILYLVPSGFVIILVLVTFLIAVTKYQTISNLRKEAFILDNSQRGLSHQGRKAHRQEVSRPY